MAHADFVHLRTHTAFTLSEGAIKVADLAALCRKYRMPAVAVTDTGNLFGAVEVSRRCIEAGVQPIIGCQLALGGGDGCDAAPDEIVLLAQNDTGYRNLIALSSAGFLESDSPEPQIAWDALGRRAEGLIALTGGLAGPVGRLLADGQRDAARQRLGELAAMFPGRLYVEIQRHGLDAEAAVEGDLIALADDADLPLVATNEAFFPTADMHEAHDALMCIAHSAYMSQEDRPRVSPEHYFKTSEQMRALFADLPEAIDNTLVVARRCAWRVETRPPLLPTSPKLGAQTSEADALRHAAEAGLEARLGEAPAGGTTAADALDPAPYRDRLRYELDVIVDMGFAGYFLIVADFVQWARGQGIAVGPGRGSGAGSRRRLGAVDHRSRPAAVRPAVRALSQSRPRVDARLRHRFLPGTPRRGDPLRAARVRRRPGRPDHHLRHPAGAGGRPRRGPGAANALRPGRPAEQDDPLQSGRSGRPRRGDRDGAAFAGGARRRTRGGATDPHRAADRRPLQARVDPPGGGRDRRPPARHADPALPRPAVGPARHAVQHEGRGTGPVW